MSTGKQRVAAPGSIVQKHVKIFKDVYGSKANPLLSTALNMPLDASLLPVHTSDDGMKETLSVQPHQ